MYAFHEQSTFPKVVINTLVYVRKKKKRPTVVESLLNAKVTQLISAVEFET